MATTDVLIFDTTLRDGEQAPGNSLSPGGEAPTRPAARRARRGRHGGGVPRRVGGRLPQRAPDRHRDPAAGHRRAGPLPRARHRARRRGAPARRRGAGSTSSSRPPTCTSGRSSRPPGRRCSTRARAAIRQARQYTDDVEFSAEDASRTDPDFLCRVVEAAIEEGARTINLPDTVGYAMPDEYGAMFRDVLARVPGADRRGAERPLPRRPGPGRRQLARRHRRGRRARWSARSTASASGPATPRMEEIVMASHVRGAALGFRCNVETREIYRTSQLLSYLTGQLPPAQQGDRRPQRLRPRGRHPPARHAAERAHLRDHPARDGRHPALDAGAGQALGPPRARAPLSRAGLRPERAAAGRGVPAVHRARRPEARDPRRGPAGAGARELPRRARGVPAEPPAGGLRQRHARPPKCG